MSFRFFFVTTVCVLLLVSAVSLPAQESEHQDRGETAVAEESSDHSQASEHTEHDREWIHNEIAVFLGATDENESHFLFRVGVGYDFILAPRYSLVPTVDLDFVKDERALVYGFNFAYKV